MKTEKKEGVKIRLSGSISANKEIKQGDGIENRTGEQLLSSQNMQLRKWHLS